MSLESESSNAVVKSPKRAGLTLSTKDVDTGAQLIAGLTATLDPEEALRVRIQFMDKTTLGSAAILGIQEATHLTANQYVLHSFEEESLKPDCLQAWHSLLHRLSPLRISPEYCPSEISGRKMVEVVTCTIHRAKALWGLLSSMFYTRTEQTLRVGYWFLMNGVGTLTEM
ncbi:hypothetical protein AZE42_10814 [Rhizopogon vesiculosus]|uniref:Uncharacterized protein n=1 Tax=Rhizopogon vesiculosus TaxID=180088 RepID=A0A1J8Q9G0_9AGAM|nr:hypothetical protein AZE42_10814 [Rhizopogon vesiculosus]